jgi:galactose mutarotase-like enzyme
MKNLLNDQVSNQVTVSKSEWYGQAAYVIETPDIRVTTTPAIGAKIVSIIDKQANHEWLLPPFNRPFVPLSYGASFVAQDMSGWDEMLPTIDACDYPVAGPFAGAHLPDHGEVWSLPWDVTAIHADALTMTVTGRALPLQMTRTMRAINSQTVRFEYDVHNTANEDVVMLWAAHPQFKVDTDTRIVLPPEVTTVVNVTDTADWGAIGRLYHWPNPQTQHGQPFDLDRIKDADLHKYRKCYLPPEQAVSWAALAQSTTEHWLRLNWDAAKVPYLGIWVDQAAIGATSTIALEPATGYYDHLARAWKNQRVTTVAPNMHFSWHLDIAVGVGLQNIGKL